MSFRRSKTEALEKKAFREFLEANAELLRASGVPISIYESRERFDYLLMHGCLDRDRDATQFSVGRLSDGQNEALFELVVRYLQAGFPDPGIEGLLGPAGRETALLRARNS